MAGATHDGANDGAKQIPRFHSIDSGPGLRCTLPEGHVCSAVLVGRYVATPENQLIHFTPALLARSGYAGSAMPLALHLSDLFVILTRHIQAMSVYLLLPGAPDNGAIRL